MADKATTNVNDVLIRAKLSVDEALTGVLGELSPTQLQRLRKQEDVNTSCTNTSCGKRLQDEVVQPE